MIERSLNGTDKSAAFAAFKKLYFPNGQYREWTVFLSGWRAREKP